MKKYQCELVFVLDSSGSMFPFEEDVIGSVNSLLTRHKQAQADIFVTVFLCSGECQRLYNRVPLEIVPPLTSREYYTQGPSAFLDGIGTAVLQMKELNDSAADAPHDIEIILITDGFENASKNFSSGEILQMVQEQQKDLHWNFLFLGTDITSITSIAKKTAGTHQNSSAFISREFFRETENLSRPHYTVSSKLKIRRSYLKKNKT